MKDEEELSYSRALVPKHNLLYKIIIVVLLVIIGLLIGFYFAVIAPKANEVEAESSGDKEQIVITVNEEHETKQVGVPNIIIDYVDNCNCSVNYPEVGIEEVDSSIFKYANRLKQGFVDSFKSSGEVDATKYFQNVDYQSYLESGDIIKIVFVDQITNEANAVLSQKEHTHYYRLADGKEIDEYHSVIDTTNQIDSLEPLEGEDFSSFKLVYSGDIIKYATHELNIRVDKNVNSEAIDLLKEGQAIEVRSGDGEWDTVLYDGKPCYIKSAYLTRKKNLHKDVELEVLDRGIDPDKPMVAITFDDGPNPISTPRILDTLEQYGVVATFFDLGQLVDRFPDIVRREESIGCEVGNHSYSHKNMNILSDDEMQEEIRKSEAAFIKALGHKTVLFRAPYGNANLKVRENWEYPIIKWNVDSLDWKSRNKNKILNEVRKIRNLDNHIILLHSIYGTTADAVEVLVPELLNQGYQLVTVSELAFYNGNTVLKTAEEYLSFPK